MRFRHAILNEKEIHCKVLQITFTTSLIIQKHNKILWNIVFGVKVSNACLIFKQRCILVFIKYRNFPTSAQNNNKKHILTSAQFQYLTFKPNLRGQDCVQTQSVTLHNITYHNIFFISLRSLQ